MMNFAFQSICSTTCNNNINLYAFPTLFADYVYFFNKKNDLFISVFLFKKKSQFFLSLCSAMFLFQSGLRLCLLVMTFGFSPEILICRLCNNSNLGIIYFVFFLKK